MKTYLLLLILLMLALYGCATGVVMSDDEAAACKKSGCTVWTDAEIQTLIREIFKSGYAAGVKSI